MPTESIALCPTCLTTQSISNSYCLACATDLKNAHIYSRNTESMGSVLPKTETSTATQQLRLKRQKHWWRKYLPPDYELYRKIDNVRKNNYMSLRLAAQGMTQLATFYFGLSIGIAILSGLAAFINSLQYIGSMYAKSTLREEIWPQLLLSPFGLVFSVFIAYIASFPFMQLGYRTLERRDELLMRIDNAINTATIATNLERVIQLMSNKPSLAEDTSQLTTDGQ
jgi:hypothetical protein